MSQLPTRELSLCMVPMLFKFFGYSEQLLKDVSCFPGLSSQPIQSRQEPEPVNEINLDEEEDFMIDDSD